MAPKGLKRLNPRPEMAWARKPRTHKMWLHGHAVDRQSCKVQKKAPNALESFDAELK
jgi:hypothetical protein